MEATYGRQLCPTISNHTRHSCSWLGGDAVTISQLVSRCGETGGAGTMLTQSRYRLSDDGRSMMFRHELSPLIDFLLRSSSFVCCVGRRWCQLVLSGLGGERYSQVSSCFDLSASGIVLTRFTGAWWWGERVSFVPFDGVLVVGSG